MTDLSYTLRNGRTLRIEKLDQEGMRLALACIANPSFETAKAAIIRILPDVTDLDLLCLTLFPQDVAEIARLAGAWEVKNDDLTPLLS